MAIKRRAGQRWSAPTTAAINFYEFVCCMHVCLGEGGAGALKQAPMQLPWQWESLKFFCPLFAAGYKNQICSVLPQYTPLHHLPHSHPSPSISLSLPLLHQNFHFEDLSRFQVKPRAISGSIQDWGCGFVAVLCLTCEHFREEK